MGHRVALFVLATLATLQVLQAMGLENTPFPDWLDKESDAPIAFLRPLSDSWAESTQWLNRLRRSYSEILEYETRETLERMKHFTDNIESGTQTYKDQLDDILAAVDSPTYSRCADNTTLNKIQQAVATEERRLQGCAATLKTLRDEYKGELEKLGAMVESRSEETIYSPCLAVPVNTVTLYNRARKCFYANTKVALTTFYYPTGATVLRTVTEFRTSIAHARDEAHACATAASSAQSIPRDIESCLQGRRVTRGLGKKLKKLLKKTKKGIKKVCSKVPCRAGVSVAIG